MIARASWYCSVWKITTTRGSPRRRRSVRTSRRAWRGGERVAEAERHAREGPVGHPRRVDRDDAVGAQQVVGLVAQDEALQRRGQQQDADRRALHRSQAIRGGSARPTGYRPGPVQGYIKRLATSGARVPGVEPRGRLPGPVHAAALHPPPHPRRSSATPRRCSRRSSSPASSLRFGVGEAFVRFYFDDDDALRRDRLARAHDVVRARRHDGRRAGRASPSPGRSRRLLLRHARRDAHGLRRPRPVGVHQPRDRLRAAARRGAPAHLPDRAASRNVLLTVALTVILVVGFDGGARGYVLGNYAASTVVLVGLWVFALRQRVGLDLRAPRTLGPLLRFGAPDRPGRRRRLRAERRRPRVAAARRFARRRRPVRRGGEARRRSSSSRCADSRPPGRRWPTRSSTRTRPRRLYALVTTALRARHRPRGRRPHAARSLGRAAAGRRPDSTPAHEALPWVALGWALYGLFLVFVDHRRAREGHDAHLPGRGWRAWWSTSSASPCSSTRWASSGAGIALCAAVPGDARRRPPAHAAAVHVPFDWARLARIVGVVGGDHGRAASCRCRPRASPASRAHAAP